MIHQMENMNFTEPDRLSFRNKVVVILAVSKKVERLNTLPTDASFAFNSNDMFPVEVIMKKPNPPNKSFPNFINFCSFRNVKYQIKQQIKFGTYVKHLIRNSVIIFPHGVLLTPC